MSNRIYKYVGSSYLHDVVGDQEVSAKFSFPKDFNDPYELFLTIDFNEKPEVLALYADAIGELPQFPTTCFSHSPAVTPMWAHYAQNLTGFAIEFDEEKLQERFPECRFDDVKYKTAADDGLKETLYRAYAIGKPRYTYMLRSGVFNAAYFTKLECWSYEQERRMLASESEIRKHNGMMLLDIPKECVTALICGPRASQETIQNLQAAADNLSCEYLQMKVGRSNAIPYFVDTNGSPLSFTDNSISPVAVSCKTCREPVGAGSDFCPWCQINDAHKQDAMDRNAYRILDHLGLLEEYVKGMDDITYGRNR
ncbi:DUF2971 domain-containing protein [Halomonas garicola]|uniref:DUF2971 domain-containing protein n=1 Tax=Halomonas garicola TaxID=1690008 RepID=UPI002896C184|nr:DUF2971 domain-containing protein [Halomonas garicola]